MIFRFFLYDMLHQCCLTSTVISPLLQYASSFSAGHFSISHDRVNIRSFDLPHYLHVVRRPDIYSSTCGGEVVGAVLLDHHGSVHLYSSLWNVTGFDLP